MRFILIFLSLCFLRYVCYGAHPLITEDTGVLGKGRFQLESNFEYGIDKEGGEEFRYSVFNNALSFGLSDKSDIILSFPYMWWNDKSLNLTERGVSDLSFELKHVFYNKNGFLLGIKPGFSLPIGDYKKSLGSGKVGYAACFIISKEYQKTQIHFNIGYGRNENKLNEKRDIYKLSAGAFLPIKDNLDFIIDGGVETNSDKDSDNDPAFFILGFIYYPMDNLDLDLGIKNGITSAETDLSYMLGLTWRW